MGFFQSKQQKPQSNLIKGTFIWVQVSVGTEYQVILCINTEAWGEIMGASLEHGDIPTADLSAQDE